MNEVLANAKDKQRGRSANAGERMLECYLNEMKEWTEENVDNALDENDNLRSYKTAEKELVSKSRVQVVKALKLTIQKKKEEGISTTAHIHHFQLRSFAKRLTSKENILSKFKKVEIEL